jgi:protein involved in polysaccharide export with SLBB domain
LPAQETNRAAEPQPLAIPEAAAPVSIGAPNRVADWQKRLLLGAGDQFDLSLYEQPDTLRPGLVIGPDGRLNYLEARDVMAAGLTVDELRARLESVLSKFHRSPRVVINPIAYNSKKYYVLGNVNLKGVFILDRPISVIEAIARAKGFLSGTPTGRAAGGTGTELLQRNALMQADLPRSFLVRRGSDGAPRRVAVDFEGLFLRGDLSQNVAIEPGDYLYFPPLDLQEVYVLGQVRSVGVVAYSPELTCLGAIAARAGFAENAWRQKVLVVRGSLNRPQAFVVDAADILSAKRPDFPLKNRDIVYVHQKPWAKVEELLEVAVVSFANSFIIGWTMQWDRYKPPVSP